MALVLLALRRTRFGIAVVLSGGIPPYRVVVSETAGPAGRGYFRLVVLRREVLSGPAMSGLLMLRLLVGGRVVLLALETLFFIGRMVDHAALAAAEARPLAVGLVDHFLDIGVVDVGHVHVIDAAVVVEVAA